MVSVTSSDILKLMENKVPENLTLIDIRPYVTDSGDRTAVATQIREVCKESGFFFVKNHGVPVALQESIL